MKKYIPSLLALALVGSIAAHAQQTSDVLNEPSTSDVTNEPTTSDVLNEPTADTGSASATGERKLFNGQNLDGWNGLPSLWSVKDGAITGTTTAEDPIKGNTFLVWQGGDVSDFELTFKYKMNGGNSGVQYRSKLKDRINFVVNGYQADFEAGKTYSGILYEEGGRGILAKRGEKVVIKAGEAPGKPKIEVVGEVGKSDEIQASIKANDWNEYKIVAKGNHLQHFINGKQTVDVTDEDPAAAKSGILALQIHAGPPMTVQFKDIILKTAK